MFTALTVARSGEVRGARWSEVDLDAATWIIPAERTKTREEHTVPLSARAVAVLKRAHGYSDASGLIFPSATGRMMGDVVLSRLWRQSAGAGTVHGLRSGFRDWAAESNISRELAESALAHKRPGVEGAYLRTALVERRRELVEDWAVYLTRAVNAL